MKGKTKGNLILLLTAVVWGTGFIAQKLGNEAMPPMAFNAIRQLFAGIVLCPVMMFSLKKSRYLDPSCNTRSAIDYRKKKALIGGSICGLCMLAGTATQQIGLLTVSAGKSGFISAIYIVFTPLFSVIIGKRVNVKTFVCIALAMFGFGVMSLKGGLGGATTGDWLTLISAAAFAAQIVVISFFVDKDNDIVLSVIEMLVCGIVGLIISFIFEEPTIASTMAGMPAILYSTFVPTAIGYTGQIVGEKYTDSTSAALIMSLESVFAAIFGAMLLAEHMSGRELLGSTIIFAAVIADQVEFHKKPNKKKQ